MGGDFQKRLLHGASALEEWRSFGMVEKITESDCVSIEAELEQWDLQRWDLQVSDMRRWNISLRWHAVHLTGCLAGRGQGVKEPLA